MINAHHPISPVNANPTLFTQDLRRTRPHSEPSHGVAKEPATDKAPPVDRGGLSTSSRIKREVDAQHSPDDAPRLPPQPVNRDYWGLLSTPVPLTGAQLEQMRSIATEWASTYQHTPSSLAITGRSPRENLEQLIASPFAQALGKKLETEMRGIATDTSINNWFLTWLMKEAADLPDTSRNSINGFKLADPENLGKTPAAIMQSVQQHLPPRFKENSLGAQVRTYALFSRFAPEFLVQDLPENLVYGSGQWAVLSAAVSRIEQQAPGTSATMTYEQVITYGNTEPDNAEQMAHAERATLNAIVDWGIANGFVTHRSDDTYSLADVQRAQTKFKQQSMETEQAAAYVAAPLPTRKQLALEHLTRVLGTDVPLEKDFIKLGTTNRGGRAYSILELYMSGRLTGRAFRSGSDPELLKTIMEKFDQLPEIKPIATEKIDAYHANLTSAFTTRTKLQLSQLPLEDRQNLQHGGVEFYSVRAPLSSHAPKDHDANKFDGTGRHGVLIKTTRDDKVTYYEVFANTSTIVKRTDLPNPLPLGPVETRKSGKYGVEQVETGSALALDVDKYTTGTSGPGRQAVIIDKLTNIAPFYTNSDDPSSTSQAPKSFFTSRTQIIASTVAAHIFSDKASFRAHAMGETQYEKNHAANAALDDAILNFIIPFKSAIQKANAGDWSGAFVDGYFDLLGFAPVIKAASKAVQVPASLSQKLLVGSNKISRAILRAANPLDGAADLGAAIVRGGKAAASGTYRGIKNLLGSELSKASARFDDVAIGSFKLGDELVEGPAVLKNGHWHHYNPVTQQAYGPAIKDFLPAPKIPTDGIGTKVSAEDFIDNLLKQRLALPGTPPSVRTLDELNAANFAVPPTIYRAHTAAGDTALTGLRRAAGTTTAGDDYLAAIIKHTARQGGSGGEVMSFSASRAKANSFSALYSTPNNRVPVFAVDTTQDPGSFRTVVDIILKDGERLVSEKKITRATLLQAIEQTNNQELEVFFIKGDVPATFVVSQPH